MSKRAVAILLAAFVVLLVLVVVGQRSGSSPAGTGAPLIAGLEAALGDIERVTVTKANGETVATLEKRPDNWVVSRQARLRREREQAAPSADGARRGAHPRAEDGEPGALRPARRRGRYGIRRGRNQRRVDGAGPRAADRHPRQRRGREVPLRAPRRRDAELSHRPQPRRAARRGAVGRLGDRRRPRRARPRGRDHARRRRGRAHLEDRPRAREFRSRRRAERPRAARIPASPTSSAMRCAS